MYEYPPDSDQCIVKPTPQASELRPALSKANSTSLCDVQGEFAAPHIADASSISATPGSAASMGRLCHIDFHIACVMAAAPRPISITSSGSAIATMYMCLNAISSWLATMAAATAARLELRLTAG